MRVLRIFLLGATALTALGAVVGGFELPIHDRIVRTALKPGLDLDAAALNTIVAANRESDQHQMDPRRHFDNARTPADICVLWAAGVDTWLNDIVDLVEPQNAEKRTIKDRETALSRFGQVTHAIQDFFSHSNYVELRLGPPSPGFLLASCRQQEFNPKLYTGYFSMANADEPHKGCPTRLTLQGTVPVPPPGYPLCHSQLNKDDASRPGHETAEDYATQATKNAWEEVRRRIIARYGADETVDAECLFTKLAWGKDRSCHRMWVLDGKLTQVWAAGEPHWTGDVILEGVKIKLNSTPTRYQGPLQTVTAYVEIDVQVEGRISAALTFNPIPSERCRGSKSVRWDQRMNKQLAPYVGALTVSPDQEAIRIATGLLIYNFRGPGPVFMNDDLELQCSGRFPGNRTFDDLDFFCAVDGATGLALRQGEQHLTCRHNNHVHRFTGTMKLDKP